MPGPPESAHAPVLVTGAGGFIGGHLVVALLARGRVVRAVDLRPTEDWQQCFDAAQNMQLDLSRAESCVAAADGVGEVLHLAADMGGVGFLGSHRADCMVSTLIDTHLLIAARDAGVRRFFFASSACVYPLAAQASADARPLAEGDAYPADPEDGYGWAKLFSERMCRHFREDHGLETRVARYHNIYGPWGAWSGGREKAPAAICRKVAQAALTGAGEIELWGDGGQVRTFTFIDDCIAGTQLVADGAFGDPVNIGSAERVTIDELVTIVEELAGVGPLERRYRTDAPQGVRGRSSDNTLVRERYGWEPTTRLRDGLARTYPWVHAQVEAELRAA
jgi:nucleoside-diphosphate-sugar epimerase